MRFVRPIRWLVSLWNDEILDFSLEMVQTGIQTKGHRFLSPESQIVNSAQVYEQHLLENFVQADFNNRRNEIISQIRKLEEQHNCKIKIEEDLLEEVTNLVEWPQAMLGQFEEGF